MLRSKVRPLLKDVYFGLGITLGTIAFCFCISLLALTTNLKNYALQTNSRLAEALGTGAQQYIHEPIHTLSATLRAITSPEIVPPQAINAYLAMTLEQYPYLQNLKFLTQQGVITNNAPYDSVMLGISYESTTFFKRSKDSTQAIISNTFITIDSPDPAVAIMVKSEKGYLMGQLDIETLQFNLKSFASQGHLVAFVDATNTYIVHPDVALVQKRETASDYYKASLQNPKGNINFSTLYQGKEHLVSTYKMPDSGWSILVYEESSKVFEPTTIMAVLLGVATLCCFFVALLLIRVFAYRVLLHLEVLNEQASFVADGNYGATIERGFYQEFNTLVATFLQMRDEVQKRETALQDSQNHINSINANLEQRVIERSKELELSQANLMQAEKMAALGQLVAGIAHELNTPLGAIQSSGGAVDTFLSGGVESLVSAMTGLPAPSQAALLALLRHPNTALVNFTPSNRHVRKQLQKELQEFGPDIASNIADDLADMGIETIGPEISPLLGTPQAREAFHSAYLAAMARRATNIILQAAEKAARVILALRTYSHGNVSKAKVITDIDQSLDLILALFERQIKGGVAVVRTGDFGLKVLADPEGLSQIWINLVSNAMHAMQYRGMLEINTKSVDSWVELSFTNNGPVIPAEVLLHIFEPFFTTKERGEGTGLGLSICQKVLEELGGTMTVKSQVGETCFCIRLPREE